jgi:pimeloyl-ACP methyl ester carboxylesterase
MASPNDFRKPSDPDPGYYITHPNGQTSFYHLDTFADPWLADSEKPVVLIQHGCAHTSEFFYDFVPRLSRDYVVIRRDARGHGRSSYPKRLTPWSDQENNQYEGNYSYTPETIVGEILDFLNQLGVQKVHFLAEATSGEIGVIFAATYPDRIASLVTMSSPTMLPPAAIDLFRVNRSSWPEAIIELGPRGWGQEMAKRPGTLPIHRGQAYIEWWYEQTDRIPSEGLAGYVIFLTKLNCRLYLQDVKCPMLILAPTNSAAVPMGESQYMHGRVFQSRLVAIDGPGHEIYADRAEECLDAILEFYKDIRTESVNSSVLPRI